MQPPPSSILVVDDSADDVLLISRAFRKAGFENPMKSVPGSKEATEYLLGNGAFANRHEFPLPRLLILDAGITGSPWELLRFVRGNPVFNRTAVVMLTGSRDPSHENTALKLGANAHHIKPHSYADMVELIKRIAEFWLTQTGSAAWGEQPTDCKSGGHEIDRTVMTTEMESQG